MKYFSTQRPAAPGVSPKPADNRVLVVGSFDTFDRRKLCSAIGLEVYGYIGCEKSLTTEQSADYELIPQKFPQYVKTYDGYIGVLVGSDYGGSPIYRFPGDERVVDRYEIKTDSNACSGLG